MTRSGSDLKVNCPQCGRQFTPWRGKRFCSELCRKRDENRRLRAASAGELAVLDPVRGDDTSKAPSRPLRGDETALGEPLAELANGMARIAGMLDPTIEAIQQELAGWKIEDKRTIQTIARRMRVAPTAVREALNG
jgi:endogenous inhibitor of DNA gyrase (YacG/DUF329 family)